MGKRSDFKRVERDFYPTPYEAVVPLLPHLPQVFTFAEPCVGDGDLTFHLTKNGGGWCGWASDIESEISDYIDIKDALELSEDDLNKYCGCKYIITNPPWDRKILHPMIHHFRNLRPTWLLFDADWMHTKQSSEYIKYCKKIVSVGRVKWIPDSKMTGKDNCAWYLFDKEETKTEFIGR